MATAEICGARCAKVVECICLAVRRINTITYGVVDVMARISHAPSFTLRGLRHDCSRRWRVCPRTRSSSFFVSPLLVHLAACIFS